jgi:hypothetical protein
MTPTIRPNQSRPTLWRRATEEFHRFWGTLSAGIRERANVDDRRYVFRARFIQGRIDGLCNPTGEEVSS